MNCPFGCKIIVAIGKSFTCSFIIPTTTPYMKIDRYATQGKITTTNTIEGKKITEYFGIVSGETIIGANVFRDFFAGIRDIVGGRAGSYETVLREAKETALQEMSEHAARLGANAVIGIDLDYETVGGSGSMLMVTAAGTAVRYQ